jgi:hypothetical protein
MAGFGALQPIGSVAVWAGVAPNASFESTPSNGKVGWKGGIPDLPGL